MRLFSFSATLLLCLACVAQAQVQFSADLGEPALRTLIERDAPTSFVNGGVLAIDRGKMAYRMNTGLADFRSGRKIDRAAALQTASMAKPFAATAALARNGAPPLLKRLRFLNLLRQARRTTLMLVWLN